MARSRAKGAVTFETVRDIGLRLPGVEESTSFGKPALKIRGKLLACVPSHKSAEPDSLVVRIDFEQRAELVAAEPDIYYLKDHYVGYACVLVRLPQIRADALTDLLLSACRFVTRSDIRRAVKTKRPTRPKTDAKKKKVLR
jgi:hypothetical protein